MKKSILKISYHYLIIMIFFICLFYSCPSPFGPCPESNWGSDHLCPECKDLAYYTDIGTCEVCGRGTSSGAFRLCARDACILQECQHCRKNL